MTTNGEAKDPIDAAVKATEPPTVNMEQLTITISSTGRPFIVGWPTDLTESELFEVIGFLTTGLRGEVLKRAAKRADPASRLTIARAMPPQTRLT
jgi:hypothetical protein